MYKAHRRRHFHSIGNDGLLDSLKTTWNYLGDWMKNGTRGGIYSMHGLNKKFVKYLTTLFPKFLPRRNTYPRTYLHASK